MTATKSEADKIMEQLDNIGTKGDWLFKNMTAAGRTEPTRMENAELRLLEIDHNTLKMKWCDAMQAERRRFSTLDFPRREQRSGLSVANKHGAATVWVYGTIGERFGGISAEDFRLVISQIGSFDEVDLRIHSDGGDFLTAIAMRSVILEHGGIVNCHVDGLAASAASLLAMACHRIRIARGAYIMIHEASASHSGRAEDFDNAAETLRETNRTIVSIYQSRWRGSHKELIDSLAKERWFNADEAVAAGLADEISGETAIAARVDEQHRYKHVPVQLAIAAKSGFFPRRERAKLWLHRCWLAFPARS